MPKFAANISMLFTELPFMARFEAAARAGFQAVECLFPYAWPAQEIHEALQRNSLQMVLFNFPPGDWEQGERGLTALPGRGTEFRDGVALALDYARILQVPRLHLMAGIVTPEQHVNAHACYLENLQYAADAASAAGDFHVMIEPINTRDMPGYFLNHQQQAVDILDTLQLPNMKLQMDCYHAQIMDGDLTTHIRRNFHHIAHMQIAGVPDRHEPDIGEICYPHLFKLLDSLGYSGWIGCEYRPASTTEAGLKWLAPYLPLRRA